MKKTILKLLTMVTVMTLILSIGITSAFAATVSSWGSIIFTKIITTGYDSNNNPDSTTENINQSVQNPSTTQDHYKDSVQVQVTTGSNTGFTVAIDGVTLTSSNMSRTYTRYLQTTPVMMYY